jgi:hypothetical protein
VYESYLGSKVHSSGRVIAQAVNRRLPTAAARVLARVRSCGIYGGQSGTGAGFLRLIRLPLLILIPPIAAQPIIWGWYNRPNSGRSTKWTQSHPEFTHMYAFRPLSVPLSPWVRVQREADLIKT